MRIRSLLLVCLLGVAAAAAGATADDMGAGAGYTGHSSGGDRDSGRDAASDFNGDPLNGANPNVSTGPPSSSGHGNEDMSGGPTRFGNGEASPEAHGCSELSWQSLLPGSIQ